MRYHYLRFDIWLCLLLSFLLSYLPMNVSKNIFSKRYASYVEDHTVSDGEIGGVAGEEVFRAQSVEDLLSHDTFTVVSPGIEYRNRGAGYHGSHYMYALTLPSGEKVAALINGDSVKHMGESIFSGDSILPVGRIVYEDLTKDTSFIGQIEYSEKLSRTDFYIDMLGNGGRMGEEDYMSGSLMIVQIISLLLFFALFHTLGSKIGIFPYFFPPKEKKTSQWE